MSLALYRKYRPGTFAEVKGQEHVTDPLRQALRTGRINHAYLFSGPRGCGKTSSARILARSLNCEKGPTPDPCGECESCVALAPTGPGHLDVIEIDAASHGGVDDARDLRERAFFAPVSARYKIYIIDEAHMVTREGFNALLKLVEEPPPHLKFIFATTEPEKVIGTIKSRTHHYPFRLMPPATLRALLEEILTSESVPFEPTALPLVVRAGAGSARDSLSILDQLLAGAEEDGITYTKAVSLLGYTDGDLLDEVVGAFAARDGAQVFHTVNRVIEGGHDPRRFASDLLERFRDLVILANVPEAASSGLLDRPADELERLVQQAASMGPAELTRAAEIFNAGLTEMRGATSPRLLLELMCARVLLPGAAQGEGALLARLERLERGGAVAQMAARSAAPVASAPPAAAPPAAAGTAAGVQGSPSTSASAGGSAAPAVESSSAPARGGGDDWPEAVRPGAQAASSPAAGPAASGGSGGGYATAAGSGAQQAPQGGPSGPTPGGAGAIQAQWAAVLAALKQRSIVVWANVSTNAQVVGVEGNLVTLGFAQVGAMKNFTGGGKDAVVAAALGDVLGGTWRVEAVVGGSPAPQAARGPARTPSHGPAQGGHGSAPGGQNAAGPGQSSYGSQGPTGPQVVGQPAPGPQGGQGKTGPQGRTASHGDSAEDKGGQDPGQPPAAPPGPLATDESWPDAPDDFGPGAPPNPDPTRTVAAAQPAAASSGAPPGAGLAAARSAAKAAAQAGPRVPMARSGAVAWPDKVPSRDKSPVSDEVDPLNDADADVDALSGMALLERELGAQVIGEIDHA
ncbi:DNA polymerase-3 subunit gamma/tau [Nonomuraea fuscirosea]|uniref:DNA polymerase III subunit gamma/tau n=1 Tax=Nonomuraea fuscirosea TaxID=1291556 RepID=A0A2T0MX11_9ACTN|nr:DNA polymerase III subunit gamma and tau [Nonomuraea fuscirosea]PRX63627.1 DNA polymerase-3 subunit gamma/tau [Nonomuraea fuscirosea]